MWQDYPASLQHLISVSRWCIIGYNNCHQCGSSPCSSISHALPWNGNFIARCICIYKYLVLLFASRQSQSVELHSSPFRSWVWHCFMYPYFNIFIHKNLSDRLQTSVLHTGPATGNRKFQHRTKAAHYANHDNCTQYFHFLHFYAPMLFACVNVSAD